MKSAILTGFALGVAALGLSACTEQEPQEEVAGTTPEAPEGIAVSDGVLMLPAVSGNPGAVYFEITNQGNRDLVIASASVTGAGSAMMHSMAGDGMSGVSEVAVRPGATVNFEPGSLHVMAMDLDESLAPGETAEVTLTFSDGDKVSFPAEVRAAGDR